MIKYVYLLATLLPLLSCGDVKKNNEIDEIHLALLSGPSAIAFAQWLERPPIVNGKTISITVVDSPEIIQAGLIKKETDLAVLPMISAANLHNKGIRYPLLGCPLWGTLYWVERTGSKNDDDLYLFGTGTTPDILSRYYIDHTKSTYSLNYSYGTASDVLQALLAHKIQRGLLSEPFVSIALQRDSTLHIVADLNNPENHTNAGFPQTAILYSPLLEKERPLLDSLIHASCRFAVEHPDEAIRILEQKKIFPSGMLTTKSIERCKIRYQTASQASKSIDAFFQLVNRYEPRAIGGRIPDARLVDLPEPVATPNRLLHGLAALFLSETFYLSAGATISRGIAGMLLSLATACVCAGLFARYRVLYKLCRPLLIIMRSVPVISFILLALIFLNRGSIPLIIGFLTMFPLLTENLTKGIGSLHPGFGTMAALFRVGRYNTFMQVVYPQLKPFLWSGLTSAAGFGWRAIIMGEVLSQCTYGIGSEMKRAQSFIAVPELLTWTIVAVCISFVFDKGINWLSQRKAKLYFSARPAKEPALSPIHLRNAGYTYGINSFSYLFQPGQTYGISAPSGTGKTTLLNMINGTLPPVRGSIAIDRSCGIASVFQEPLLLPWLTVTENIALPLTRSLSEKQAEEQALSLLEKMNVDPALATSYPEKLSYGQQQRVALARALLYRPASILLMDEPFKGLDDAVRNQIIDYLKTEQKKHGQILIFTSHNAEELALLADQTICLA